MVHGYLIGPALQFHRTIVRILLLSTVPKGWVQSRIIELFWWVYLNTNKIFHINSKSRIRCQTTAPIRLQAQECFNSEIFPKNRFFMHIFNTSRTANFRRPERPENRQLRRNVKEQFSCRIVRETFFTNIFSIIIIISRDIRQ